MPDTVTAPYGVTDNQVAAISQGFTDGLWRPYQSVTRAQFVKMAVAASHTSLMNPAVATFSDVPKGSHYYKYIEGAVKRRSGPPGHDLRPQCHHHPSRCYLHHVALDRHGPRHRPGYVLHGR